MGKHSDKGGTLPENQILSQMAQPQTSHGQQSSSQQAEAAGKAFDALHAESAQRSAVKDPQGSQYTPKP